MKYLVLTLAVLNLTLAHGQSKSKPITELSQKDLDNALLVDVRTPKEFQAGHLDKAKNINWFDADFTERFAVFDKDTTIYLYCKKGGRSTKAQSLLDSLGYRNVIHLDGGYDLWRTND